MEYFYVPTSIYARSKSLSVSSNAVRGRHKDYMKRETSNKHFSSRCIEFRGRFVWKCATLSSIISSKLVFKGTHWTICWHHIFSTIYRSRESVAASSLKNCIKSRLRWSEKKRSGRAKRREENVFQSAWANLICVLRAKKTIKTCSCSAYTQPLGHECDAVTNLIAHRCREVTRWLLCRWDEECWDEIRE